MSATSVALVLVVLTACSQQAAPRADGPYAAQFAQARRQAVSDFQRQVLADDVITDQEFRETRQRYVDCLADAGIHAVARDDGAYDLDVQPVGESAQAERKCSAETIQTIEPLYYSIQVNPDNADFSALIAACLVKAGVVDAAFTKADWDRFVTTFAAAAGDGSGPTPDPATLPTLPGGAAMTDPRVQRCSDDPLGLKG